jgi:hypothetical protein
MLSKADLMHFSLELAKKLDIRFRSPPLPVDLSLVSQGGVLNAPGLENFFNANNFNLSPGSAANLSAHSPDLTSLQAQFAPRTDSK